SVSTPSSICSSTAAAGSACEDTSASYTWAWPGRAQKSSPIQKKTGQRGIGVVSLPVQAERQRRGPSQHVVTDGGGVHCERSNANTDAGSVSYRCRGNPGAERQ